MKVSEFILLQERLSNLNTKGKHYLSVALNDLPKYPNSFLISLKKIAFYIILMAFIHGLFQHSIDVQLLLTAIASFPFFFESLMCLAIWDSWNIFTEEIKKQEPNYEGILKHCIDTRTNIIKTLTLSTITTLIFASVTVVMENGIIYSLIAASILLIISYFKGNQCLLRTRLMLFISKDISQFRGDETDEREGF